MTHASRALGAGALALTLAFITPLDADERRPTRDRARGREPKSTSPASVVLNRHCPGLVQPYKLTDNVGSVLSGAFSSGLDVLEQKIFKDRKNPRRPGNQPPEPQVKPPAILDTVKASAKQMNWLPMSAEVVYGEQLHKEETNLLDRESRPGKKHYPAADKILESLLATIEEEHEYEFKVFVLKNASRNALARPGGFVYLDEGLLENVSPESKVHFALAHEIAHVLQRHETKELQSTLIDSVSTTQDLIKLVRGVRNKPDFVLTQIKMEKNLFTRHHVDQELQADSCAVRMLGRMFSNPRELAAALNAFLRDLPPDDPPVSPAAAPRSEAARMTGTVQELVDNPVKRHPTNRERYQNLRTIYDEIVRGLPPMPR